MVRRRNNAVKQPVGINIRADQFQLHWSPVRGDCRHITHHGGIVHRIDDDPHGRLRRFADSVTDPERKLIHAGLVGSRPISHLITDGCDESALKGSLDDLVGQESPLGIEASKRDHLLRVFGGRDHLASGHRRVIYGGHRHQKGLHGTLVHASIGGAAVILRVHLHLGGAIRVRSRGEGQSPICTDRGRYRKQLRIQDHVEHQLHRLKRLIGGTRGNLRRKPLHGGERILDGIHNKVRHHHGRRIVSDHVGRLRDLKAGGVVHRNNRQGDGDRF